jgi:hypothetical protein
MQSNSAKCFVTQWALESVRGTKVSFLSFDHLKSRGAITNESSLK